MAKRIALNQLEDPLFHKLIEINPFEFTVAM